MIARKFHVTVVTQDPDEHSAMVYNCVWHKDEDAWHAGEMAGLIGTLLDEYYKNNSAEPEVATEE